MGTGLMLLSLFMQRVEIKYRTFQEVKRAKFHCKEQIMK
jgi:hypothetical protein